MEAEAVSTDAFFLQSPACFSQGILAFTKWISTYIVSE